MRIDRGQAGKPGLGAAGPAVEAGPALLDAGDMAAQGGDELARSLMPRHGTIRRRGARRFPAHDLSSPDVLILF